MRKFLVLIRMAIIEALAYRGDVFIFVASSAIGPLTMLLVWLAVFSSGGRPPLSLEALVTYYLSVIIVQMWNSAWSSPFLSADIRYGRLTPSLLKPMSHMGKYIGQNIGEKVFKTLYLVPVIILLGVFFRIQIPLMSPVSWLVFILSWLIAACLSFLFDWMIGLASFWLEEASSFDNLLMFMEFVFSGRMIPLVALPIIARQIGDFLPFRSMLSFPVEILTQNLSGAELASGLAIQILWLILFIAITNQMWRRGLKRYSAVGA